MRTTVCLLIPLLGCSGGKTTDDTSTDSGGMSAEDQRATDLWSELSGYESWDQLEEWTGIVASDDGTHGAFVSIWMNNLAAETIAAGGGTDMPAGAILVKEGYSDAEGAESKGITVMVKESGWGDDGWFWAKYPADDSGVAVLAGSVNGCTGCHSSGQDSVRFASW